MDTGKSYILLVFCIINGFFFFISVLSFIVFLSKLLSLITLLLLYIFISFFEYKNSVLHFSFDLLTIDFLFTFFLVFKDKSSFIWLYFFEI